MTTKLLEAVFPFEPVARTELPVGDNWIAQVKWDGVRMLVYQDRTGLRLFNRRKHERTLQYPELTANPAWQGTQSLIVDGEIIAWSQGKPSFHEVMRRDSLRKATHIQSRSKAIPVVYMVFDLLYMNGEWVTARSLAERQQLLKQFVQPNETVQLVESSPDTAGLLNGTRKLGLEGIVVKDLQSTYRAAGKDARWQKLKHIRDVTAVVGGVTFRGNRVNALLLGLYKGEQFVYIGHAGTGKLTEQEWHVFTGHIRPFIQHTRPFTNEPERSAEAIWLKPYFMVKIHYLEVTPGGTLRQPSIQGFVAAKPVSCVWEQLLES